MGLPLSKGRRAVVDELRRRIRDKYNTLADSPVHRDQIPFGSPSYNNPQAQARARAGGDKVDQHRRRKIQGPDERAAGIPYRYLD